MKKCTIRSKTHREWQSKEEEEFVAFSDAGDFTVSTLCERTPVYAQHADIARPCQSSCQKGHDLDTVVVVLEYGTRTRLLGL
jgi:hypothetical protein